MRALVRRFDAFLRRRYGVFEFTDDQTCLLRLQIARAPHSLDLPDRMVRVREPVLVIHFWNEHMPPLPGGGPDLAWAARVQRLFVRSLRGVARQMQADSRLTDVCAVGGVTVLLSPGSHPGAQRLMQRLGFVVTSYHSPQGRFGEFWENFYTWWLMWTFNAVSLRPRRLIRLRRAEIWMSAEEFLRRYGGGTAG